MWITTTRFSSGADGNGPTRPIVPRSPWWCSPTGTRVVSVRLEIRQLRSPVVTSWPFSTTTHGQIRIGWTGFVLPYGNELVVAVGGAPMPEFEGARPRWFPFEFDWVFGCAYSGLPEKQAPLARLIGANMSVRRLALAEIGGFHSDNHDDMDMCHRLMHRASGGTDRLRADGTGPSLRSGSPDDVGVLLATLLLREQGKGRGLPSDGRSGRSVRRRRFRGPSVVPWRVERTATGVPGRRLGCGEGRIHPGRDRSGGGGSCGRTRNVAVASDATGTTISGVADLSGRSGGGRACRGRAVVWRTRLTPPRASNMFRQLGRQTWLQNR